MFIESILILILADLSSILISKLLRPDIKLHYNTRWFFVHFIVNFLVTYLTFEEVIFCIKNVSSCTMTEPTDNAKQAINLAILAHIYHMIIFSPYLKSDEWYHHIIMVLFNSVVYYLNPYKTQGIAVFFATGLPGMIDYFMLFLVKLKYLDSMVEKKIYFYLTTYIRSPGCMLCCFLSIPFYWIDHSFIEWTLFTASTVLIFFNGQYYMSKTCFDYGNKLSKLKN